MSSKQEIVIMMACKYIYLHQGGPFHESHEFAMLFIKHLLDILMNANIVKNSFVKSKNEDVDILHTHKKLNSCCPYSLEHLSLCEFISTYQKIPSIKQLLFKEPNPQRASHPLKIQTLRCMVNVFGAQLLDISQEYLALEKCLSYLWTLFILHKPFHYLNDLLGGH
jgi:hypothetical protein